MGKRDERPGGGPLQNAADDEHPEAAGYAAQERGHDEQERGPEIQPHLAHAPGEPAGERDGDGVGDPEEGDDPRPLRRRHAEVARDGGQGDVGDGGVEHGHGRDYRNPDGGDDEHPALKRRQGQGASAHGLPWTGQTPGRALSRMMPEMVASTGAKSTAGACETRSPGTGSVRAEAARSRPEVSDVSTFTTADRGGQIRYSTVGRY